MTENKNDGKLLLNDLLETKMLIPHKLMDSSALDLGAFAFEAVRNFLKEWNQRITLSDCLISLVCEKLSAVLPREDEDKLFDDLRQGKLAFEI